MRRFVRAVRRALWLTGMLASVAICPQAIGATPTLIAQAGVTAPASIAELARALKYDVDLIFEYVYTNIEYTPIYGVKKGALGTILDGRGNDFDQSALLVALLRQSGYTASYVYGSITLTAAELNNWLGVDPISPCPLFSLLDQGAIPGTVYWSPAAPLDCDTSQLVSADIDHVWVSVTGGSLGSSARVYDPSLKKRTAMSSGIDLAAAMQYDRSTFLASATSGSTITSTSIQNVNRANLRDALKGYANNLVQHIRTYAPTTTLNEVVGGNYIEPKQQPFTPLSYQPFQTPNTTPTVWTGDIPDVYRTTLQIQIGGINKTYFGDAIYGHRLSIVYNASLQPVLYLDGVVQGTGTANANVVSYAVSLPFCWATSGPPSSACAAYGSYTNIFNVQNVLQAGNGYTYAIINGWDATGRGMVDFHRRQLDANRASGASMTSEAVLGEALNMVGYAFLAQLAAVNDLNDRLIKTKVVFHCNIGVVGQVTGPYIDMPGGFLGTATLVNDANRPNTAFFTDTGHLSALEWGTLDQNLAKSNVGAVSTVKLLDIANSQGTIIYDANSANWSTILPQLSNYQSADLANIQNNFINAGSRVILPQKGNITQDGWTGVGYIALTTSGGLNNIYYGISSNLKGGYVDSILDSLDLVLDVEATFKNYPPLPQIVSFEPIDLGSGAYLHDSKDLTIGSGEFPYSLTFARSYNSNNRYSKGALGLAWSHGFAMSASVNSDGLRGLGQDSPIDAAAAIVEAYVAQDLLSDPIKPLTKMVIASLTQTWFMDQLINSVVNVTMGSQVEQFQLLADGSYNPQLGFSDRLSLAAGIYTLTRKDGTKLVFNAAGNVERWESPSGMAVMFGYNAVSPPQLTSVSNSLGRSLTLTYNGAGQLTGVSDNATPSRSVQFGYDASGNLVTSSDPLGNSTVYRYSTGGAPTPGLLTEIFNPTSVQPFVVNTYDSLGRIMAQANANNAPGNDTTWQYYFAGYRSEEIDPYGARHVLYYNPRGKALFDIQDAASSSSPITTMQYDGLDRPTAVIQPEGNSISYAYDAATNPWANNVATTTRTPKPGSPLLATKKDYTYNPYWNKVATETDWYVPVGTPNPSIAKYAYDGRGNLVEAIADFGTARFNATSRFAYDGLGRAISATNPTGTMTVSGYDASGNLTSTIADYGTARLNLTTRFTYDSVGNVTSKTDPKGNVTTIGYDAARRPVTTTGPAPFDAGLGLVQTINTYDADGQLITVTRSNGTTPKVSRTAYTGTGKVQSTTDPNGNQTLYTYDLADRRQSIAQPVATSLNRTTRFTYDALGRAQSVIDNYGNTAALFAYTANGKIASFTNARSKVTGYSYDGFDRLVTTTYPASTAGTTSESNTYDANDNVLSRTTRAGATIAFTYDTLNRLSTKTPPSPAAAVGYSYDLAGRMTAVNDNSAAIASAVPPSGNRVQYETTYAYDNLNRVTNVVWDPAPSATAPSASDVTFGHAYNRSNQRIGQTATDNSWWYYPTPTAAVGYVANDADQYTAVTGATPSYDANGNLTGDGTYTLGYDSENRLATASGAGNTASYAYDPQGRRKRKTVNGTTTIFLTDADNREVLEYDGTSGQVGRWYAYGLGPNDAMNRMDVAGGTRQTYIPDIQGSVVGMLSSAGVLTSTGYLPYGGSAGGSPAPFGYTGQRLDGETGLYYYRARMYHTAWGRFAQSDPIGYQSGANLYAYVGNDPLYFIDPLGLAAQPQSGGRPSPIYAFLDTSSIFLARAAAAVGNFAFVVASTILLSGDTCNACNDRLVTSTTAQFGTTTYALPESMRGLPNLRAGYVGNDTSMQFFHYSYFEYQAGLAGGLRPGSFATTLGNLTGLQAQQGLSLPNPNPPTAVYAVTPTNGTPYVFNPSAAPMFGQPGGLPEVWFPTGTGPGTVSGPRPVAPEPPGQ